jgi:hypothetical protein
VDTSDVAAVTEDNADTDFVMETAAWFSVTVFLAVAFFPSSFRGKRLSLFWILRFWPRSLLWSLFSYYLHTFIWPLDFSEPTFPSFTSTSMAVEVF